MFAFVLLNAGNPRVNSFLTEEEFNALANCGLDRLSPYLITSVRNTQMSIARHYGGIEFRGKYYIYLPDTDELIRDDVLGWLNKNRRKQRKLSAEVENKQSEIF